jgi:hypothetical protein
VMDLDPDTLAAARVVAYPAAYASMRHDPKVWHEALVSAVSAAVETAYPIIAAQVARATADAIADQIEAEQKRLYRATVHHRQLRADEAAEIARKVVASPDGRETVQATTSPPVAETPVQPVN